MQGRILLDRRRGLDQCEFPVPGPTDERGIPDTGEPPGGPVKVHAHWNLGQQMLAPAVRTGSRWQQMPTRSGCGEVCGNEFQSND